MRVLVAASLVFICAVPAARADIFAVADTSDTSLRADLAMVDASTGARVALPATVNTAGDEFHPAISSDGKKLVLERRVSGDIGNLSLFVWPLLKVTSLSASGLVGFDAIDPTRIGILVQRVVGMAAWPAGSSSPAATR